MSATTMTRQELGQLANNGAAVQRLQTALGNTDTLTRAVPMVFKGLAKGDGWQRFLFPDNPAKVYEWNAAQLRLFIESPRPGGCQTPCHVLERMIRDDVEAWELYQELTRGEQGAPAGNQNAARKTNCDNITVCSESDLAPGEKPNEQPPTKPPPTGTSVSYALRRLKKERQDLYEQVKAQTKSCHAAMVEAGFREPSMTIPLAPRKAARRIVQRMTREQFSELVDEALKLYLERGY